MLGLIRWVLGYVRFVAKGMFPEKLMNLIAKSNISIWDAKRSENEFSACVVAEEYKEFRKFYKRSGTKIKVLEKHGLPFEVNKYKKRKGMIFGILAACLFIYILSLYIWDVKIVGDVPEDTSQIESVISELGLSKGKIKSRIDASYVEQNMMLKLPNLSWVSVNIDGSVIEVSIKQREMPPYIVPKTEPCNIKSKMDAQIIRMEVYNGTSVVNDGDAVVKGQLLVSGVFEDKWGGNAFKHADAKVWAYTKKSIHNEINLNQQKHILTNKTVCRKSMRVFGVEIPLTLAPIPKGDYSKETKIKDLYLFKQKMPINLNKEIYTKEVTEPIVINEDEAKVQAEKFFEKFEENEFGESIILEKTLTGFVENDKYIVDAEYKCQENIAQKEAIILE